MDVAAKSFGAAVAIVGLVLWVVAVAVEASLMAVVIPILMVMGGGLLMVQTDRRADGDS